MAVSAGEEEKALRLLAKSEGKCIAASPLLAKVYLEPLIVTVEAAVAS